MAFYVILGDGHAPADFACAVYLWVVPRSCSNLAEILAYRGQVDVCRWAMPPGRRLEPIVQFLDLVPREQCPPDGGPSEFDLIVWPCCVSNNLRDDELESMVLW